jgi:hypothetical protein
MKNSNNPIGNRTCSLPIYSAVPLPTAPQLEIEIYRNIILPVVLYGFGNWSLTSREEYGVRVFESRMLRRILGPKR